MSNRRYYLVNELFDTPPTEIPAWAYYLIVGSFWLIVLAVLFAFIAAGLTF